MSDLSFHVADYNHGGLVIQADARIVQFRMGSKKLKRESDAAGRPIHGPQILFCVRHPGERDETVVEATEFHKQTHPREWAAFEQGRHEDAKGTPLAVIFPSEDYIVKHLRSLSVFTVEMLASVTAEGLRRIGMGAQEYQARAIRFLEAADRSAPVREMEAKLRERDEKIQALEDQIALLVENMKKAAEDAPRRRGRPPNVSQGEPDE